VAQSMRSRVRRRWPWLVLAAIFALGVVLSALSGFFVDLLWFREVHFSGVFWSIFWSKAVLGVLFGLVFFALLFVNLLIVRRLTPQIRTFSPEQEAIERYRAAFEPYLRWIILGFSALIALFVGVAASGQWQTFLLWRSVGDVRFGAALADPVFHRDPSFYIFVLPFQHYVQGWLFSSLVGVLVLVGVAHYLTGGIRTQGVGERVTPQVKAHLSVLLGLIVLVKAWGYYLGKFDLLLSPRGVVTGASYTDLHAQKPALQLLVFIAIVCAVLFLVNIRFRGWALPALGIGLLALTSIIVGGAVPAAVQRFTVGPQELQKETQPGTEAIQRNIANTRFAFGVNLQPTAASPLSDFTSAEATDNQPTVDNIRLWNPAILHDTYQALQRIQPYYEFKDVDVDRYSITIPAGAAPEERMVMLSAREVSQGGIPAGAGWQASHLIYTHGYGAVASLVNTADLSGAPTFLLQNIPPVGGVIPVQASPPNDQGSQVYYGELHDVPYVVTDTNQAELNFPSNQGAGTVFTPHYEGSGGIPISGFFRKLLFAYRYKDINLLISGLINSQSKILINRDIQTRISKAAPFLQYDADPYAAIIDGRLYYIQDAYTTTNLFPYSQRLDLAGATNGDLKGSVNYIRNSVKAVVDAYNGTVTFYVADPTDPLIRVWQRAFPHLFTQLDIANPATAFQQQLVAHFRYPEDFLQAQAAQFARYHVTDAPTFFSNTKRWAVPGGLPTTVGGAPVDKTFRPYYQVLKLPGTDQEQFVLFQPLTPSGRQNMVAYMAAGSDPGQYGKLSAFEFPSGENVDGPAQVRSFLSQDPNVSPQITLLSQQGSAVKFGDLIVVPIGNSFLYVQPVFVVASNAAGVPIPELKRVIVVHGGNATIATTLMDALNMSLGKPTGPGTQPGPPTGTIAQLLQQALQHFQAANAALKAGDLAGYQREIDTAQQLIQQAQDLAAKSGGGTTPSPTPSVSPSG
jgi:uncharacterized membrane protein (UPF0182 family)